MLRKTSVLQGNVVRLSHAIFQETLEPGDIAVDATCGNGKDCLILAQILKGQGRLVAYDVQQQALDQAALLCSSSLTEEEMSIIEFKKVSHEYIDEVGAKLFHYNLGYLPNGDKSITTLVHSTLISLQNALRLLGPQGVITVVCYPGHEEGYQEMLAIEELVKELDSKLWEVGSFHIMNRNKAPKLIVIRSLKGYGG